MTTCPNCGSIVMEGDPYCTHCGTTFQWSDDDEEMEKRQKVIEKGDLFFCPYCHYEVDELDITCDNCGRDLWWDDDDQQ